VAARRLVLIRHAKSAEGPVDVDRTLAPRGVRDSRAIGEWLSEADIAPDRVAVSPARRARQTWEGASAHLAAAPGPVIDARIYDNEAADLFEIVRETSDDIETLVLVGHNPSFEDFAHALDDGDGDPDAQQELAAGYRTSCVAVFEVESSWAEIDVHVATLVSFAVPRG
jgi:phosphohistidine phosphatase